MAKRVTGRDGSIIDKEPKLNSNMNGPPLYEFIMVG